MVAKRRSDLAQRCIGEPFGQFHTRTRPRHLTVAVGRNIIVESPRQGHAAAALDHEASVRHTGRKAVMPVGRLLRQTQFDIGGAAAERAFDHLPGTGFGTLRSIAARQCHHSEKKQKDRSVDFHYFICFTVHRTVQN